MPIQSTNTMVWGVFLFFVWLVLTCGTFHFPFLSQLPRPTLEECIRSVQTWMRPFGPPGQLPNKVLVLSTINSPAVATVSTLGTYSMTSKRSQHYVRKKNVSGNVSQLALIVLFPANFPNWLMSCSCWSFLGSNLEHICGLRKHARRCIHEEGSAAVGLRDWTCPSFA